MIQWITDIVKWLYSLWSKIPKPVRKKIIETIIEIFKPIFGEYYDSFKTKKSN